MLDFQERVGVIVMTIRGRITEKTVLKLQAVGVGVAFHHTDPTGVPVHTLTNQKQGAKDETPQKISGRLTFS